MKSVEEVVESIANLSSTTPAVGLKYTYALNQMHRILTEDRASVAEAKVREIREAIETLSIGYSDGRLYAAILALPCLQLPSPEPPVEPWMVEADKDIRATLQAHIPHDLGRIIAQAYARRDRK